MVKISTHLRDQWMGALALFLVLAGGTAWAAVELGKNDVKSKNIKDGGVKARDLGNDAVTAPKVANGSLLSEDFAADHLPQGPKGEPGPKGDIGPPGPTHFARVTEQGALVDGTATSATRVGTGTYDVRFPESVADCAGAATSAGFPGGTGAVFRVDAFLRLGTSFGAPDVQTVRVDLSSSSNGDSTNTSFMLLLACPSG